MEATENTLAAFNQSLRYGVDGMETDIQLSRDGIAVLWHDRFLNRIGRNGKRVDDFDFAELTAMKFPEPFCKGKNNVRIVGLEEFVEKFHGRTRLLLEVKNREWDKGTSRHELKMRHCIDLATRFSKSKATVGIMISSFDFDSLAYAHQYSVDWPLIYNSEDLVDPVRIEQFLGRFDFIAGLCLPIDNLTADSIDAIRRSNKTSASYTCNEAKDILKSLHFGIDVIITDNPKRALKLRDR